jgi:hypothetical protein
MYKRTTLIPLLVAFPVAAISPSLAAAWAPVGQATVHPGVQVSAEAPLGS